MNDVILSVIEYLHSAAKKADDFQSKWESDMDRWRKNRRGKKPIPPIALPVAAQQMRNAADTLADAINKPPGRFELRCALCEKYIGIAYTDDRAPLTYCSRKCEEENVTSLVAEGMEIVRGIIDKV